jgi:leader peptidase (prepilin peptidase) / N-methyltransferase
MILSVIDGLSLLLPDFIVLPALWLGLILNSFHVFVNPSSAILGAAVGYLSLLLFAWVFKQLRGIDGLGRGDCKMLAMLGAWLGWQNLPLTLGIAALIGLVFGLIFITINKKRITTKIPFGPFLAIAGWVVLIINNGM